MSYRLIIRLAGGTTVPVNLTADKGFSITEEMLKRR